MKKASEVRYRMRINPMFIQLRLAAAKAVSQKSRASDHDDARQAQIGLRRRAGNRSRVSLADAKQERNESQQISHGNHPVCFIAWRVAPRPRAAPVCIVHKGAFATSPVLTR